MIIYVIIKFNEVLTAFSGDTVWLIVSAFILARAFIITGLGRRIAYLVMRSFGDSSVVDNFYCNKVKIDCHKIGQSIFYSIFKITVKLAKRRIALKGDSTPISFVKNAFIRQ